MNKKDDQYNPQKEKRTYLRQVRTKVPVDPTMSTAPIDKQETHKKKE
jgi:hypothetical protein